MKPKNMLNPNGLPAQSQQIWRWIIMVLATVLLLQVVLVVPSVIDSANLYFYKTDRHYVFKDISELDCVRSIKLQNIERDVLISDVKISEKRQYSYDGDKVILYAYKLEDKSHMHELVRNLEGETYGTRFELSAGYHLSVFLNKADYFIYSDDSLLIVKTKSGVHKINEIILILDEKLSEAVKF